MALSENEVLQVLELFQKSDWQDLQLQSGSLRLNISKTGRNSPLPLAGEGLGERVARPASPSPGASRRPLPRVGEGKAVAIAPKIDARWIAVKAPMLGTFYAAPKPGASPFIALGQAVTADDTVGILEVMKLMNYLKAGVSGRIAHIAIANGDLVEFDQALIYIDESSGIAAGGDPVSAS